MLLGQPQTILDRFQHRNHFRCSNTFHLECSEEFADNLLPIIMVEDAVLDDLEIQEELLVRRAPY